MSNSTCSTFKNNERVEAFWGNDCKWYPARIVQVMSNGIFRIKFEGYTGNCDFPVDQLRKPMKGCGAKTSEKAETQVPKPAPAIKPSCKAPKSSCQANADRIFETFKATSKRPSQAPDYYTAVESSQNSPGEHIAKQLRRQCLAWHADKVQTHADSLVPVDMEMRSSVVDLVAEMLRPVHDEEIRFLNKVKEILSDPRERAKYDAATSTPDALSGLDDLMQSFFASGCASRTFNWSSDGGFVHKTQRERPPQRSNKVDRGIAEAVRTAVAEAEAKLREEIKIQAAVVTELRAQLQQQNDATVKAQAEARSTEHRASDLIAQVKMELTQAEVTIAQLQSQVQKQAADLTTQTQVEEARAQETAQAAKKLAELQEQLRQEAEVNNRLRAQVRMQVSIRLHSHKTQVKRLKLAVARADAKAAKAERRSTANNLRIQAKIRSLGAQLLAARTDAASEKEKNERRKEIQKNCNAARQRNDQAKDSLISQLHEKEHALSHQNRMLLYENRRMMELIEDLIAEGKQHARISEEQIKQKLNKHCRGS
jgi:hypothetical protein